jgi:serine protease inhibitor
MNPFKNLNASGSRKSRVRNRYLSAPVPLILLALFILPACEKNEPVREGPRELVLNKKSAGIIRADQQFAFELFREVSSLSEEENIMISPLSVSCALGMTMNGSAGTTLDAFYRVLHFGELTNQEVNESYKDLMDQLVRLDEGVKFSIANSIWYRMGFNVLEEFINTNRTWFDAEVSGLDFSDPQSVDVINGWIEDKTGGKIRDMLDYIPPDAVMYLVNAVYFNARWKYRFNPEDTYQGSFHLQDGSSSSAGFMKINGAFRHAFTEEYSAVELPYGDSSFSMVVVLPSAGLSPGNLIEGMDAGEWDNLVSGLNMGNLQVELPRFRYGFKDLLNDALDSLGLGVAFSGNADFSRISPGADLFISRVIHQTFIDVKEEGTEAAAATIVEIRETSAGPESLFRADRPFLYFIRENSSGAILFMGKVGKPVYEENQG